MVKIAEFKKVSKEQFFDDINRINEDIYGHIKLPKRATKGSAGHDIYAPMDIFIEPGQTMTVPTGIRCKISSGWVMLIFPRSSMGIKHKMSLNNTVAVIDEDYYYSDNEGHIFISIKNNGREVLVIPQGKAFCQAIFVPFGTADSETVTTVRNGGIGSTSEEMKLENIFK